MKCASNQDRECTPECAAYEEDRLGLHHVALWDKTQPVPQYVWSSKTITIGPWCGKDEFYIGKPKEIEKDGKLI